MFRRSIPMAIATAGIALVAAVMYVQNRRRADVDDLFDDDVVCDDDSFDEDDFGRGDPITAGGVD